MYLSGVIFRPPLSASRLISNCTSPEASATYGTLQRANWHQESISAVGSENARFVAAAAAGDLPAAAAASGGTAGDALGALPAAATGGAETDAAAEASAGLAPSSAAAAAAALFFFFLEDLEPPAPMASVLPAANAPAAVATGAAGAGGGMQGGAGEALAGSLSSTRQATHSKGGAVWLSRPDESSAFVSQMRRKVSMPSHHRRRTSCCSEPPTERCTMSGMAQRTRSAKSKRMDSRCPVRSFTRTGPEVKRSGACMGASPSRVRSSNSRLSAWSPSSEKPCSSSTSPSRTTRSDRRAAWYFCWPSTRKSKAIM
mmetsp:Transcript_140829/g.450224  ORF Transcript_140829/g.450224 Transcript_140829/m.450224 type:complete len:314 (-) Transcript_140829:1029-1970(-)